LWKKLNEPKLLNCETKSQFQQEKVACEKLAAERRLKIAKCRNKSRNFAARRARLRQTNQLKSARINRKLKTSQKRC
jgi:hypothetical protein